MEEMGCGRWRLLINSSGDLPHYLYPDPKEPAMDCA
jgi:hypothetical protein